MLLIKTLKNLENIAASRIQEMFPTAIVESKPRGSVGIVFVKNIDPEPDIINTIKQKVYEVEKVLPVYASCKASIDEISEAAAKVALRLISKNDTFAVRTTRRGKHEFSSVDVNIAAGSAVQSVTGALVNLSYPDKIVWIEIFHDEAFISITSGSEERKKSYPGKPNLRQVPKRIVIGQVPYVGDIEAVRRMGIRIGRAAQTFEIKSLYVTPFRPLEGFILKTFLDGVYEGIKSRYEIQKKAYSVKPHRVPVYVYDLYQFVRLKCDKPIIVTSTRGKPLVTVKDSIIDLFSKHKEIIILIGAHEGLPTGLFRAAELVIDLAPGITISTDNALTSAVIGLVTVLEESKIG